MSAITAIALVVTCAAIFASMRHLRSVYGAMSLESGALTAKLREGIPVPLLAKAIHDAGAEPEGALCDAILATEAERPGRTNEVLFDIDDRFERWSRVPRVAATVASSVGFLLASLALRHGLADAPSDDLPPELREALLYRALIDAVNAVAFGLFGALTCALIHSRARAARRARMHAVDLLVQELETRSGGLPAADRVV